MSWAIRNSSIIVNENPGFPFFHFRAGIGYSRGFTVPRWHRGRPSPKSTILQGISPKPGEAPALWSSPNPGTGRPARDGSAGRRIRESWLWKDDGAKGGFPALADVENRGTAVGGHSHPHIVGPALPGGRGKVCPGKKTRRLSKDSFQAPLPPIDLSTGGKLPERASGRAAPGCRLFAS